MGMGIVWDSNSNSGSHPFLENVFLTCWESKCLEIHAHPIIHPYVLLSHIVGSPDHFSFMFPAFPHLAMARKTCGFVFE